MKNYIDASNPSHSVWVSASAGTGKTRILTNRVLRLLLENVPPEKILCLTFTKASASEMNNRINKEIANWAIINDSELNSSLTGIFGYLPDKDVIKRARNLFTSSRDFNKLNISTIHSFCQTILKKFPLEAGINPNFQIIDEYKSLSIIEDIHYELMAGHIKDIDINSSIELIAEFMHDQTIFDLIKDILNERVKFEYLFDQIKDADQFEAFLRNKWEIGNDEVDIIKSFLARRRLAHIDCSEEINKTDIERLSLFNQYIALSSQDRIDNFLNLKEIFLTQDDSPRKKIFTQKFQNLYPSIYEDFQLLQQDFLKCFDKIKSIRIIFFSKHLFLLARAIIKTYISNKKYHNYLDYNDLINFTVKLLEDNENAAWVMYKLDGGIDHILVDEAQDTSLEQWLIIKNLVNEFFAGNDKGYPRTLFVVGDHKQSIFSFQGADPTIFREMQEFFLKSSLKQIELGTSYRSTSSVINFVSKLFEEEFKAEELSLNCHRLMQSGKITLWPLITQQEEKMELFWPTLESNIVNQKLGYEILAEKIANYIASLIADKHFIPSRNRAIEAGDIIILIRQRDQFGLELIKHLKLAKIMVAGIDRLTLAENLAIKDLIALGNFLLLPEDDLNLACLLKSPICGLSEEALFNLCAFREDRSLIEQIALKRVEYNEVYCFLELARLIYHESQLSEFYLYIIESLNIREKLCKALGPEYNDPIDEFINLVMNFEKNNNASLQKFLHWFEHTYIEIKRDLESEKAVRIMTVHGSKGLQAPLVILADTTSLPLSRSKFFWTEENFPIWAIPIENDYIKFKKLQQKQIDYTEYIRLLYVAVTRAEDELIIAGEANNEISDKSWYSLIKKTMEKIGIANEDNLIYMEQPYAKTGILKERKIEEVILPIVKDSPVESKYQKNFISKPERQLSSLFNDDSKYREYGVIFHRLIEEHIKCGRTDFDKFIAISSLDEDLRTELKLKFLSLTSNEYFINLLKYPHRTELSIGTSLCDVYRIDLLIEKDNEIIIIDYKTDRFVPEDITEIPIIYISQLKQYKEAVRLLYRNKKISCKLLWLENISFMDLEI